MALTAITTLGMPIFAFMFIVADDLIYILLGEQWIGSVPIARALCIAAFSRTMIGATAWVYISLGLTKRQLYWHIIQTPVTILAVLVGLPWGPVGVATSFSISQLLLRLPAMIFALRGTPVQLYDVGISIWRPALASISAAALVAVPMIFVLQHFGPFARFLVIAVFYSVTYFSIWLILLGGRKTFIELFDLVRQVHLHAKTT
jgi:PST family polysaccharide transporter